MTSARPSLSTRSAIGQVLLLEGDRRVEQHDDDLGEADRRAARRRPRASRACPRRGRACAGPRCRTAGSRRPRQSQSSEIGVARDAGLGPVSRRSSPIRRLISVDLPAFGRPTMATLSGLPSPAPSSRLVVALSAPRHAGAPAPRRGRPGPRHARPRTGPDRRGRARRRRRRRPSRPRPRPCWRRG